MNSAAHRIGPDSAPDRYRLLRSIGRGGEAVLYLAEIELAGAVEPVVVKVLDSRTALTAEEFDRLSRSWSEQAELLRFVHRPGVVGVREHFQGPPIHPPGGSGDLPGRALALVMNRVDGLDLADWRAGRTLADPAGRRELLRTLEQLADVLDWLHSGRATPSGRAVVHGDLSPGNVMVDEDGQATLVDFGLSKLTADHRTAEIWFTPGYAAPEVFEGLRTPATDRYAFGAIAYFLLTGGAPPPSPGQLAGGLAALPRIAGLAPARRERVVAIASADPDRRPASLSAWVADLRHGVTPGPAAPHPPTVQDAPPPPLPPPPAPPRPVAAPPPVVPPSPPPPPEPRPAAKIPPRRPPLPRPAPPPPRRRRRGPVLAAAAGLVLLTVLAAVGVRSLLGGGDGGGDDRAAAPSSPSLSATLEAQLPSPRESVPVPDPAVPPEQRAADPRPEPDSAPLTTFRVLDSGGGSLRAGIGALDAKRYETALVSGPHYCSGFAEYNLNKEWAGLTLTAGIDDESPDRAARLVITLDEDNVLHTGELRLGHPEPLVLDVRGGLRLRIDYAETRQGYCYRGDVVLGDPTLTRR